MNMIYRGNSNVSVEKREHANEGTYRGVKHNNTIENNNINKDELKNTEAHKELEDEYDLQRQFRNIY